MSFTRFTALALGLIVASNVCAYADAPPRKDLRGDSLPSGAVARLGTIRLRHPEVPFVFSPDGRYLAAASWRSTRLFDAKSGQLVHRFDQPAQYVTFSPDSKILYTSDQSTIRVWNLATKQQTQQMTATGWPTWSADGKRMAHFDYLQNRLCIWDMDASKQIAVFTEPFASLRKQVQIWAHQSLLAPDGKTVAMRGPGAIHLFDSTTGQALKTIHSRCNVGYTADTRTYVFSPDSRYLASVEEDRICLWETATGKLSRSFKTTQDGPRSLVISDSGRYLAAGGAHGTLYIWDLGKDKLIHAIADAGTGLPIYLLAITADGKSVATQAHHFPSIRLWDVTTGKDISPRDAHAGQVDIISFSPDGKTIATVGPKDLVQSWDGATGKWLRRFASRSHIGYGAVSSLAILPDNKTLAMSHSHYVVLWDLATSKQLYQSRGNTLHDIEGDDGQRYIQTHCSPAGQTLLASFTGEVQRIIPGVRGNPDRPVLWNMVGLWDFRTGKVTGSFQVDAENLYTYRLAPDRKTLLGTGVAASREREVILFGWDLNRGREVFRLGFPSTEQFHEIGSAPDGRMLISRSQYFGAKAKQNTFQLWETATAKQRASAESIVMKTDYLRTAFADDRLIALAEHDTIYLIDPSTGAELQRLQGHEGYITALAFSPDRRFLASGSDDCTVLIWDVTRFGKPLEPIRLSREELGKHWEELLGADASKAYQAIRRLSQAPEQTVAFLKERLHPTPGIRAEQIQRFIAQLDSRQFAERENATKELLRLEEIAEPALTAVVRAPASLEARCRAEEILRKLHVARTQPIPPLTGEPLRQCRAIEVLERIASKEAKQLIRELAKGSLESVLTREAEASSQRLSHPGGCRP